MIRPGMIGGRILSDSTMETIEKLGKYEVRRVLGKGAASVVYEGWDSVIARRVAIKTVRLPDAEDDPEAAEALLRFRREAQAAGRLTHPNIVGVFDYGETSDLAYIVMEFVDGPPVKSLLDKQERFTTAATVRLMTELLRGLQFSHSRGVVHRDIKPGNIVLSEDGQAKITDFGIARIESSSMTQDGTVLGTPAYMSPEQFMGQVVDARSDIYSAGVVLYQLLTGERPFEGGMSAIMHKALHTEPVAPSQLAVTCPSAFDAVVLKAMAKRPEDRFQSASAFLEAIRAAADGQRLPDIGDLLDDDATVIGTARTAGTSPSQPMPSSVLQRPAAPASRRLTRPMMALAAAVLLLVAGGGAWFVLVSPGRSPVAPAHPVPAAGEPPRPAVAPKAEPEARANGASRPSAASAGPTTPAVLPSATPSSSEPPHTSTKTAEPSTKASPPVTTSTPHAVVIPPPSGVTPGSAASTSPPVSPLAPTAPAPTPLAPTPLAPTPLAPTTLAPMSPPANPVTTPPAEPQIAAVNAELIHHWIAQVASNQPCALVDGGVGDDGHVTLTGLAGRPAAQALRQSLDGLSLPGAVRWHVQPVDESFCPALDVLRPIATSFDPSAPRLGLTLAGGETRLHDGQHIRPQLVMPDFKGHLTVDYITHDGTVVHLYPQVADAAQHLAADPPRVFSPGELLDLGTVRPGHPPWEAGQPYGTDIIIAIAASQPLFTGPRSSNGEDAASYLRALEDAVQAARARGDRLTASAITVDTLPPP